MKKIGIITVSRTTNFGAELQTFALQHKLNQLRYNAEVIDYLYFKNKRHKPTRKSKSELPFSKKEYIINQFKYQILLPIIDILFPIFHNKTKVKNRNFATFHKNNTRFSLEFRSIDALYQHQHHYDVVISGSDQVWNPATFSSLKPYLLDFVPQGTKRIAYAASFGVAKVPESYSQIYAPLFKKLDSIGVREESGKDLIKQITDRDDAHVVLDPTLLLNKADWQCVTHNIQLDIKEPYILIYDLHPSSPLLKVVEQLREEFKLPVYRLCKRAYKNPQNNNIINIEDAGPAEFVYLFMNASYVITNSFHGTVFSSNFNIPFNVILNPIRTNNSRITGFLSLIGLSERIIWEDNVPKNCNHHIEFISANQRMNELREKSLEFIYTAIDK